MVVVVVADGRFGQTPSNISLPVLFILSNNLFVRPAREFALKFAAAAFALPAAAGVAPAALCAASARRLQPVAAMRIWPALEASQSQPRAQRQPQTESPNPIP